MFDEKWNVLLVDDELDVLLVSKLAMQGFEVYGLPLEIHTAEGQAQALELLSQRPAFLPKLAVAFIDVVMETDHAGLELCQTIREEKGNKLAQLYIRTGQPGIAPEATIIDRYDISGYLTKAEATEDKLYSLVKSGVRQYLWSKWSLWMAMSFQYMLTVAGSQTDILTGMARFVDFFGRNQRKSSASPQENNPTNYGCLMADDRLVGVTGWDEETAFGMRTRLSQLSGSPLGLYGDKHVVDESGNQLLQVVMQEDGGVLYWIFQSSLVLPEYVITIMHQVLTGWATIWSRANK